MFNPGKIKTVQSTWNETCTMDTNLIESQSKNPLIRPFLEHTNKRMISTLLVSGAVGQYGVGYVPTKIGKVDEKKFVGNNAYRFDVMGRIQKSVIINHQVGATAADGTFQLSLKDNYIYPGQAVYFYGAGFQARCMGNPTGSTGNYIYTFQSFDGDLFVWATHVAGQSGDKTCFGAYSSYGEASLRGYGRTHTPEQFVQHMTTQRAATAVSGGVNSEVIWHEYEGKKGGMKGWRYFQEVQRDAQFLIENETQKWDGISNMKNTDGTLRSQPRMTDSETGNFITTGDGILQQIGGGNETSGSGVNGEATGDDISDMMSVIRKKSNQLSGRINVVVTGEDGYSNAQEVMPLLAGNQNVQLVQNVNQTSAAGGAEVHVGFNYASFNVAGDQTVFIKHPMFDDELKYPERGADGKLLKSSQMVFLTMEVDGRKNMEILSKGARNVDRSMVSSYINGLTGDPQSMVVTPQDKISYEMLKEDMIIVYNTSCCGIINKVR